MPRWVNIALQVLAVIGQLENGYGELLPGEHRTFIAIALGVGQIIVSAIAHAYNPDGTPAAVAYTKGGDHLAPPKPPFK